MSPKWQQALLENATRLGSAEQAGEIGKEETRKHACTAVAPRRENGRIQRALHQRKALTLAKKRKIFYNFLNK
jgi:CRISPR/Cas system-associated protein Csm6